MENMIYDSYANLVPYCHSELSNRCVTSIYHGGKEITIDPGREVDEPANKPNEETLTQNEPWNIKENCEINDFFRW